MSSLRQALYGLALLGALALLLWGQYQRSQAQQARLELSAEQTRTLEQRSSQQAALITELNTTLQAERTAQAALRTTQDALRQNLTARLAQIKELEREHTDLRQWSAQPLPVTARRLRERPALSGAAAYQKWLPSRSAVPPATRQPDQ